MKLKIQTASAILFVLLLMIPVSGFAHDSGHETKGDHGSSERYEEGSGIKIHSEKSLIKYKTQKKLDTIIGISSVAGDRGKKKNSIYSSSKSAFSSYLDGLRQRLYSNEIHVITVKPGWVATKMKIGRAHV